MFDKMYWTEQRYALSVPSMGPLHGLNRQDLCFSGSIPGLSPFHVPGFVPHFVTHQSSLGSVAGSRSVGKGVPEARELGKEAHSRGRGTPLTALALFIDNVTCKSRPPNVPNTYTILSCIPTSRKRLSVVDLSNAFLSVPVYKDCRHWSAFSFNGKQFTRLC